MHGACTSHAWGMYITCMRQEACIPHAWDMYITCTKHVYHMLEC